VTVATVAAEVWTSSASPHRRGWALGRTHPRGAPQRHPDPPRPQHQQAPAGGAGRCSRPPPAPSTTPPGPLHHPDRPAPRPPDPRVALARRLLTLCDYALRDHGGCRAHPALPRSPAAWSGRARWVSWPWGATAASLIDPPQPHDTMADPAPIDDWSTPPPPGPRPPPPASQPGTDHALTITQPHR
jgi:hypothetical protein